MFMYAKLEFVLLKYMHIWLEFIAFITDLLIEGGQVCNGLKIMAEEQTAEYFIFDRANANNVSETEKH